jgi:hypothetical protein
MFPLNVHPQRVATAAGNRPGKHVELFCSYLILINRILGGFTAGNLGPTRSQLEVLLRSNSGQVEGGVGDINCERPKWFHSGVIVCACIYSYFEWSWWQSWTQVEKWIGLSSSIPRVGPIYHLNSIQTRSQLRTLSRELGHRVGTEFASSCQPWNPLLLNLL